MPLQKVLVANRGEIALRIVRALRDLDLCSVAVNADDDAGAPHVAAADEAVAIGATGPAAYLDGARLLAIAKATGCDAIHPGYGFLSERADFARACAAAGVRFVGPTPEQLEIFGDKARARALAKRLGVPLLAGSKGDVTREEAQAFFASQDGAGVIVKAVGGGGGRGMRIARTAAELDEAWARCRSEALAAFGVEGVYVERLMDGARHVEIQIIGDGDNVVSLGERECTLQRRFQKLVEIAPSPSLPAHLRTALVDAALKLARDARYESLGTFEFLVDLASTRLPFVFIEANPRLQVEHTITEEVTGVELVQTQIRIAAGARLGELDLDRAPRGFAIQWRISAETLDRDGTARPGFGTLTRFDLAAGPGIRIDTHGVAGGSPSPHYDTLLAKLVVSHPSADFADVLRRSRRALGETRIEGIATNLGLLAALAARPEMASQTVHTRWLESVLPELVPDAPPPVLPGTPGAVVAPTPAKLVQVMVAVGDVVPAGALVAVLEAMKMELEVKAPHAGRVSAVLAAKGDFLTPGQGILTLEEVAADAATATPADALDPDHIRPDLQRVVDRTAFTRDENRTAAVTKRHAQGGRTARENIGDLCDDGSFAEYGAFAVAAQARRRTMEDLVSNTPADGMVTGLGTVNAADFGPSRSRTAVLAYDYTVLAGTQGWRNHAKTDRLLDVAHQLRVPVVLFAEGGGGRPGETDFPIVAGLNNHTFTSFAKLSGKVPVVGIVHGRCFAGNAALLGCADVIIATEASNIGMGGPAMIEGGGLGIFRPEEIGPSDVQTRNGVIDVLVKDEAAAVSTAKKYLAYFQGSVQEWKAADQRLLRHAIPENRLRIYDVRAVVDGLFDEGSGLELRPTFGIGILTSFARLEGRPVGVIANNPNHLGGAIDVAASDKAARFMQLCNVHGLPIVSLCDTPGFMVGPAIEREAQVRHTSRMFLAAAHLGVPFFAVVLRKGYGLGAQAMCGGGFDAPIFTVSWPTGEFGGMGLEGFVRLGYKKELEAAAPGAERDALFQKLVADKYEHGTAISMATTLEIDAVIDPADTRSWLVRGLDASAGQPRTVTPFVDAW